MPLHFKLPLAFVSNFIAWLIVYSCFAVWQIFLVNGFGYLTDFDFLVFWTLFISCLAWLLFWRMLLKRFPENHWIFRPVTALFAGGLYGVFAFTVLISWIGVWRIPYMFIFAGAQGGISFLIYAIVFDLLRGSRRQEWIKATATLYSFPFVFLAAFSYLVWPTLEDRFPRIAYRLGTRASKVRIEDKLFKEIRVGTTLKEIEAYLPGYFSHEVECKPKSKAGSFGRVGDRYFEMDNCVVVKIHPPKE